jgi:hypothetical protein
MIVCDPVSSTRTNTKLSSQTSPGRLLLRNTSAVSRTRRRIESEASVIPAIARGTDGSEIVSTATDILTLIVVTAHGLAHLSMIHMLRSVDKLNKTERPATGTMTARVSPRHTGATTETMIDLTVPVEEVGIIMDANAASVRPNGSGPMSVGLTPANEASANWTMETAAQFQRAVAVRATRAAAGGRPSDPVTLQCLTEPVSADPRRPCKLLLSPRKTQVSDLEARRARSKRTRWQEQYAPPNRHKIISLHHLF